MKYKIGTRDSKLALIQTELVCSALINANPELTHNSFEIVKIKTIGDKILNKNLVEIGGKNLFVKEIEEALLERKIDFAVHSLKDMTANLNSNLIIAACIKREDPRDAFVSLKYDTLDDLPLNAIVGTSSIRRKTMLLKYRPDLNVIPFRGNVLTRLEKLKEGKAAATFLAMAGLKRLAIEKNIYTPIEVDKFLPAISQGIIGVQCYKTDDNIYNLLRSINHQETEIVTHAERGFLESLDADCSLPIASYATISKNNINLSCWAMNSKGDILEDKIISSINDASTIGYEMGEKYKIFMNL